MQDLCFFRFSQSIDSIELPQKFTYPFNYKPHELSLLAANQLQEFIKHQCHWNHDFGITHFVEDTNVGKMFGVLVVKNQYNELGFLAAFSGKIADSQVYPNFVPPISNFLEANSFYRRGEEQLKRINERIYTLQQSKALIKAKKLYEAVCAEAKCDLQNYKERIAANKQNRNKIRSQIAQNKEGELLLQQLAKQSSHEHYTYKQLVAKWNLEIDIQHSKVLELTEEIEELKKCRRIDSFLLQQQIFDTYTFLNARGEKSLVCEIFAKTEAGIPPAGAGDCAAPKLLQHAFIHGYKPIAMAEFWWGQAPKSEIRKHMHFYPSCKSKCEPILGFMLQGIEVDENPVIQKLSQHKEPQIIFEDEVLIIVNKPADMLSVPGKIHEESVFSYFKNIYTQPLYMVHRLDMSTSGILVIAKTQEAYYDLQQQFMSRTVRKRYVAVVDGEIVQNSGTIQLPLRVDLENRPSQLVCFEHGKPAVTSWKVVERIGNTTRLYLYPHTGRTHQLRVHCAHPQGLNCPIRGDELYGTPSDRLYLHAEYIQFVHPVQKEIVSYRVEAGFSLLV